MGLGNNAPNTPGGGPGADVEGPSLCGACAVGSGQECCPKHGEDFMEFKCLFCCKVWRYGEALVE